MNGYDPRPKRIYSTLYRPYCPTRAGRPLARKRAGGVHKRAGTKAHTTFLHRVQVEIKSTARKRLTQWVAEQNDR